MGMGMDGYSNRRMNGCLDACNGKYYTHYHPSSHMAYFLLGQTVLAAVRSILSTAEDSSSFEPVAASNELVVSAPDARVTSSQSFGQYRN